jgi:cytochrome d ubiquinol oxidase subunit I
VDALLLARIQFAFTMSFHIVFPALTIGLASFLAVLEALWLATRKPAFMDLYRFWLQVFAIAFGMGVVSGIIMAYQFGTNWSEFSRFAGGITGPLLTYEVLTAFFLEAGFLGVMLFGLARVGPGLHFMSTCAVATGTLISATWIIASNSWMQTPQGYAIVDGRVVPTAWLEVIFNPSFPWRLSHMVTAAFLSTALMVASTGAWQLLRGRASTPVRYMLSMAMWMIMVAAPLQVYLGDAHGLNTLRYQPAKIAAIEGHWANTPGVGMPLVLLGWPDMGAETTRYSVEIPRAGSILLTHSRDGTIPGLKSFPKEDRPNSTVVFWTFRVMVGLGTLMVLLAAWAAWLRLCGHLYDRKAFLWSAVWMGPAGLIALLAGWMTTEIGRQPWIVYGLLRTADAVSPHPVEQLQISLVILGIVYPLVFGAGTGYALRLLRQGPRIAEHQRLENASGQPPPAMRPPLSASDVREPSAFESGRA